MAQRGARLTMPRRALLVEPVDLDHDAVGLVRQLVARLLPVLGERDHALDVEPGSRSGLDREAEVLEARQGRRLARRRRRPSGAILDAACRTTPRAGGSR